MSAEKERNETSIARTRDSHAQSAQNPARRHHVCGGLRACAPACRAGSARLKRSSPQRRRDAAEHPCHLRRRHRPDQHQRLFVRPDGIPHAEHRPHRPGRHDVHRLLRRAELHGGAVVVHHRPGTLRTGLSKVGLPGATVGLQARDATIAEAAQAARLRHRPVRQEPSWRPERIPADGAWLRRVLRQSLPPQRRGGAGESRLSARPALQGALRTARRAALQGDRPRRSDRSTRAGARSASRPSRTPARSPRSAWRRSTTRRRPQPSTSCKRQTQANSRSSAGSTRPACISARMFGNHRDKPGLSVEPNTPTA